MPGRQTSWSPSRAPRRRRKASAADTLFYVATAQLGAIRPGGRIAPADSMRENVILRLTLPRP
jgi:hypothetical protein